MPDIIYIKVVLQIVRLEPQNMAELPTAAIVSIAVGCYVAVVIGFIVLCYFLKVSLQMYASADPFILTAHFMLEKIHLFCFIISYEERDRKENSAFLFVGL